MARQKGVPNPKYEYKGQLYTPIELARMTKNKSSTLIVNRIRSGWTVEEAVETPLREKWHTEKAGINAKYQCVVDGRRMCVSQLAAHIGLSTDTIYHRLSRGTTLQEIADAPEKKSNAKKYPYQGKTYTAQEIAEMAGCSVFYVKKNIYQGYSVEYILEQCREGRHKFRKGRAKVYQYNGKSLTLTEISKLPECAVDVNTLRHRMLKDWTIDEAVRTPLNKYREQLKKRGKQYEYNGKSLTLREISELPECKVSYIRLRDRIAKGWSIDEAVRLALYRREP